MAGGTIIVIAGQESFPHRDYFRAHPCDIAAQDLFAASQWKGRQIVAAGGQGFNAVVIAADADHLFNALVVRGEFFVGQRPVDIDAVETVFAEVGGRVAQDYGVPMNGAAS